jgi:hypothetical protein
VPDDERPRRRLGDETKNRIAGLASGWSLEGEGEGEGKEPPPAPVHTPKPVPPAAPPTAAATPSPASPTRNKPRTNPPPPPGSAERKALEDKIVETARPSVRVKTSETGSTAVGESSVTSPPTPPRSSSSSGATSSRAGTRSGPQFKRAGYAGPSAPFATESRTFTTEQHTPAVIVDDSVTLDAVPEEDDSRPNAVSGMIIVGKSKPNPAPITSASSSPVAAPSKPIAAAPSKPLAAAPSKPIAAAPSKPLAATPSQPPAATPAKPLAFPLPPPETSSSRTAVPPTPAAPSSARLAVPVGEFDSGVQTIEQDTMRRDAADALLQIPEKETPVEDLLEDDDDDDDKNDASGRGDPTMIDPLTAKFERGDPTQDGAPDATMIEAPSRRSQHSGGTLRPSAALRRKRGLAGDVRYVFTALFGVRRSRRELAELEHRQSLRQTSRRRHLVTLGRTAVINDTFDHPVLGKAREQLQAIEDERSRHAGAVSASDAELERVRRDREAKAKQYGSDITATDAELADLAKKLAPLEKEATVSRKRAQELRESLQRIDRQLAATETLLTSVKGEKLDKAAVLSDIASLKADRQSVLRDEPVIAAELDALNPRIAAIEGSRTELRKKRGELEKAEVEDQRRTSELLEAIGAKRKVVERAAADAETARDTALFELGDRLYVDRPKSLSAQLAPIDQIDLELGEGDRRMMELKEILSNIDKAKFARGIAMIVAVLGIAGCLVAWLLHALL